jgi:ATP-dependent Clp protease ATP-binding subunit ClpC
MTPRLIAALSVAGVDADGMARSSVASLDLLRGLLDDGENLAVRILVAQEIDLDALRELSVSIVVKEETAGIQEATDTLIARMTMPARAACAIALEAVIDLGHNYVGCEHLLIGLIECDGSGAELLRQHGVRAEAVRQALNGAIAGIANERRSSASRDEDAFGGLARRIEAIERQLAGKPGE